MAIFLSKGINMPENLFRRKIKTGTEQPDAGYLLLFYWF